ncbi:NAD(P)/FAD-dependent oxidoreductase [Methylibium sp. Root1272]|uniref:flavin-containing monooxygenase n=1 Tax=Methylibium sp. Root1272 TaxID=1736441 RepID=UPI000700C35A|nr:NAD(P)/FAD-dependent oxidoreductase [Methylibium sp. Root1272]KQW69878.1 cyclohexanone monooxygenase [Methylibium sp. Root1272]
MYLTPAPNAPHTIDVVVVGAGFAGLYALHVLRKKGYSVRVFEAGDGIGGTWYWNRYPGARCDIESVEYSYSFDEDLQQEWDWPARYADQADILKYINHVADRFDLRRGIQLETRVTSALYDEAADRWTVATSRGETYSAQFCIMATGCLSTPKQVDVEGIGEFRGRSLHTAAWPREGADLTGLRVGVIGTGSSGIQAIPHLAAQAAHLTVFQRTPNFSIPAWNHPLSDAQRQVHKAEYAVLRAREWDSNQGICRVPVRGDHAMDATPAEREAEYEARWQMGGLSYYMSYVDLLTDPRANETVAEFVRNKIRQKVKDPVVAEMLCPKDYPFGTKRLCADSGYYETYNRDNVTLVDLRATPFERFDAGGVHTADGRYHGLDVLVTATGFDALTGTLSNIDIRGRGGERLSARWRGGPRTALGIMSAGFPNLFVTTGPGSPSVLFNMILGNEYHVDWIVRAIEDLRRTQRRSIEPTAAFEEHWTRHVNEVGNQTLFTQANSWYMGANVPGKARQILLYLGGFKAYKDTCEAVASKGYEGFALG